MATDFLKINAVLSMILLRFKAIEQQKKQITLGNTRCYEEINNNILEKDIRVLGLSSAIFWNGF
jgi:hypothetical protein